jgi:hypothetical protein
VLPWAGSIKKLKKKAHILAFFGRFRNAAAQQNLLNIKINKGNCHLLRHAANIAPQNSRNLIANRC